MEYILTAEEMKRYDSATSELHHIPASVLMERAALSVYDDLKKNRQDCFDARIIILCGTGNNGGDGLALGRLMLLEGKDVSMIVIGDKAHSSQLSILQTQILISYGAEPEYMTPGEAAAFIKNEQERYDCITVIDAVFGIGLSRELSPELDDLFEFVNNSGVKEIAVDIPSGISADGRIFAKNPFKADITYTFGFLKLGHVLYPSAGYCGETVCLNMGIDERSITGEPPQYVRAAAMSDFKWPARCGGANKGSYGKLLVIAGSEDTCGAALLAVKAAFACGIGMVMVCTHEKNREIFASEYPEAMLRTYNGETSEDEITDMLDKADAWSDGCVIGPGIGQGCIAKRLVEFMARRSDKPVVMDADALNILSGRTDLMELLAEKAGRKVIFTPHLGEFSRLSQMTVPEIHEDMPANAKSFADRYGCTLICKDASSVIASAGDNTSYINTSGNDGMATAGSGDVLAGICGVLNIQMDSSHEAAAAAAYVHGLAGCIAAEEYGRRGMKASDIASKLKDIWSEIND